MRKKHTCISKVKVTLAGLMLISKNKCLGYNSLMHIVMWYKCFAYQNDKMACITHHTCCIRS